MTVELDRPGVIRYARQLAATLKGGPVAATLLALAQVAERYQGEALRIRAAWYADVARLEGQVAELRAALAERSRLEGERD